MATHAGYDEFKQGWPVVLSSMLGIGLGLSPLPFYTVGVFAPLLMAAFGWKISEILTSLLITTAMIAWAGPMAGLLAVPGGRDASHWDRPHYSDFPSCRWLSRTAR